MAETKMTVAGDWTLGERARRHLCGNECPHIPTDGQKRSGFGCDRCTQTLIEDTERDAVAAEREQVEGSWDSMRDEILHGDGTLDNDQTNWVLSIIDDHDLRASNPESRKRMNVECATHPSGTPEEK